MHTRKVFIRQPTCGYIIPKFIQSPLPGICCALEWISFLFDIAVLKLRLGYEGWLFSSMQMQILCLYVH